MKTLHSKKSFQDFTDRELMMLLLANQVKIFREIKYVMSQIKNGQIESAGLLSESFGEMISTADAIIEQSDEYLGKSDADKGFLHF